jgi:hypothetical protein
MSGPTLKERIVTLLRSAPGLTDREITDRLFSPGVGQQAANQAARALTAAQQITRRPRKDGKVGNYLTDTQVLEPELPAVPECLESRMLSEDEVKRMLQAWLEASGWQVSVIWGRRRGIDIEAKQDGQRWVIEAKGCGSLNPMRVNYFLSILGELLQRMDDPDARYSIALPDMKQFRRLWERLPRLAKSRTMISVLFVDPSGKIEEVSASS